MAESRPLLERLLKTPDLATVVPHLQPEILHRVIQICGLEDAAELVALATPAQLTRILDADIWRVRAPGADEELDAGRFGVWLEVLMQSGAAVAAEKLTGLDLALVVAAISSHTAVFDHAAVASYTTLDGTDVPSRVSNRSPTAEIGGYVIEARRTSVWDTIVDLLAFLESDHSEYFHRLMRECVRLSNGPREADAFNVLLQDEEQSLFDLATDREARQQQQGYVTPAQARAFMHAARDVRLASDSPPHSPLAHAYFRDLEATLPTPGDPRVLPAGRSPESPSDATSHVGPDAMAQVVEVLRDAGVLTEEPRGLLQSAEGEPSRLAFVHDYIASHPASPRELAYLANVILAGCAIQARPFTRQEASDAVVAICNLGLENWQSRWSGGDLVSAFQVGCTVLHRDVCLYVATRLNDVVGDIKCSDRDIQMRLHGLRRQLRQNVRDAAPWRSRNALDVLVMLDAPCWAALVALIDECPVIHAAMDASRHHVRAISPSDFEFISTNSQVASVREFMDSLPARLTL